MTATQKGSRSYMTLNRASEWRRALLYNLTLRDHAVVTDGTKRATAVLITGSADSGEYDFIWRNLLIDATLGENIIMKVSAYAANTTIAPVGDDRVVELDSFLSDDGVPAEDRLKQIGDLFTPIFTNCTDAPVNLRGRYIWLKLEFVMLESHDVELRKLKLLLSGERMVDYLPELYREEDGENGFLTRFLSIFDSLFFALDDDIAALGNSLDYRVAEGSMLRYLAGWLDIEDSAYLSDEVLRTKIKNAISDHRRIGVKRGIAEWIRHEYGCEPNIIEYFDVRNMIYNSKDRETYQRLFGENPFKFFVVMPEGVFASQQDASVFMQRLKKRIPAHTEAEVIVAKQRIILEDHTYLGSNTVLSDYTHASMDAGSVISHDIILGGSDVDEKQ